MAYIRLSDSAYPFTEKQIKTILPAMYPRNFRAPGFAWVFPTPKPECTILQRVVEGPPELTALGSYQQTWNIVDKFDNTEDAITFLTQELQASKVRRKTQLSALYSTYLYADVPATFPSGQAVIQFRDDNDRMNLANVVQAAQALIIAGTPSELLVYRTQDNVNQEVTAIEMMTIGMEIMAGKQSFLDIFWGHNDAVDLISPTEPVTTIALMEAIDTVNNYDITIGWEV